MYILGINGNVGRTSHDPAAVILKNGDIVFAAEEERYNGIKHSNGKIPINAIKRGLEFLNINISDIVYLSLPQVTWGELFDMRVENVFKHWFGHCPKIKKHNHHLSHAASAYYSSGFSDKAIVYSIDGSGDSISLSAYLFDKKNYDIIMLNKYPNSMGLFYSLITQYLGFYKNSDEYKVMSLAALGVPRFDLSDIITYDANIGLTLNIEYISNLVLDKLKYPFYCTQQEPFYSEKLGKYCARRLPNENIEQSHKDLAASLQKHFENINIFILKDLVKKTRCNNIIISGGSMLNCKFIGKMLEELRPDYFYIPPFPDDSGISIGSAMLTSLECGNYPNKLKNAFLGDSFTNKEIRNVLNKNNLAYEYIEDNRRYERISEDILNNLIVANFNGRMEFGPRALGNRSIFANVKMKDVKFKLNNLKKRYDFQPFAVAIKDEYIDEFFENYNYKSPYMNIAFRVKEEKRKEFCNVIHFDDTVRVQTIDENSYEINNILNSMINLCNIPYVINTSFNMKGKPIINKPEEAIAMLYATELDVLYLGDFRISKKPSKNGSYK